MIIVGDYHYGGAAAASVPAPPSGPFVFYPLKLSLRDLTSNPYSNSSNPFKYKIHLDILVLYPQVPI